MTPLETALIILILVQTLFTIIIAITVIYLLIQVRKAIEKANTVIDSAGLITSDIRSSLNTLAAGVTAITTSSIARIAGKAVSQFSRRKKA